MRIYIVSFNASRFSQSSYILSLFMHATFTHCFFSHSCSGHTDYFHFLLYPAALVHRSFFQPFIYIAFRSWEWKDPSPCITGHYPIFTNLVTILLEEWLEWKCETWRIGATAFRIISRFCLNRIWLEALNQRCPGITAMTLGESLCLEARASIDPSARHLERLQRSQNRRSLLG